MIKISYSNVKNLNLSEAYSTVTDNRKKKIDKYRFQKDKKLSCGVEILLLKLLKDIGITNPIFKEDKFGKPYLANYQDIHFNMSHSGEYVACGISDKKLGLDIEYNDPEIELDIAKNYFYNKEYLAIMNSKIPSEEFFNYWVLKESYMKYTGLGFRLNLNSFEIIKNNTEIYLKGNKNIKFSLFDVDDYKLGIASGYNVKKIEEVDITSYL